MRVTTASSLFLIHDGTNYIEVASLGALPIGRWHHIVGTYDKQNIKLYVNGILEGTTPETDDISYLTPASFLIGAREGLSPEEFFDGAIDEVRIYNRALSKSEIQELYSGLVSPGQLATVKPLTSLTKGTHTLRLCTSSMCNTAYLTIN